MHPTINTHNQPIIFEQLPKDLLFQIFANLPLNDVIKFNRLSKLLRQLVNTYLTNEIKIKQIACGYNFSFILLESGRVFAMGSNNYGQLGLLGEEKRSIPTEIIEIEPIDYISSGFTHVIMLSKKKRIWIMGSNGNQQLALNKQVSEKLILHRVATETDVQSVIASDFTTAYIDNDGIYHFGINDLKPYNLNGSLKLLPEWVHLPVDLNIVDISIGKEHALLLTADGDVYGIGSNQNGLLGLGDKITKCENWTLLPVNQAIKIKATDLASFILNKDKELRVAGVNSAQQLENSEKKYFNFFKKIATGIINFDAHEFHTIYVDTFQKLYALGHNDEGQLGIGFAKATGADCSSRLIKIDKPKSISSKINKNSKDTHLDFLSLLKSTNTFFKIGKNNGIKDSIYLKRDTVNQPM